MDVQQSKIEWLKASKSFVYFVATYIKIYDAILGEWIPFDLWDDQKTVANAIADNRMVLILKARQLGITWLCLAYVLWMMIFRPSATAMLFSRRETEAGYLMWRLKNMYERLPEWMKAKKVKTQNTLTFALSNGSVAYGFPTTAGDSYTASVVLVDEADLVPNLDSLMGSVKPTIDAGGKMMMISRTDKTQPMSPFKNLFRAALKGENPWFPVFLPWWTRPDRTEEWYQNIKNEIWTRTMSLDELHEQYPATPEEAMEAIQMDKRLPSTHLQQVFELTTRHRQGPLPGLTVFVEPEPFAQYVIGADPAEGNPKSDDSSAHVLNKHTGEECAILKLKAEPTVFASYLESLSTMYNRAKIMPERNNHGHVLIATLPRGLILNGLDGKPGWHTSVKSKANMYSRAADVLAEGSCKIHSTVTMEQLLSIEGSTLRAPDGLMDDAAVSFCLALLGINIDPGVGIVKNYKDKMYAPVVDPRMKRIFGETISA